MGQARFVIGGNIVGSLARTHGLVTGHAWLRNGDVVSCEAVSDQGVIFSGSGIFSGVDGILPREYTDDHKNGSMCVLSDAKL